MILRFEDTQLDSKQFEVRRSGQTVSVEPAWERCYFEVEAFRAGG